MSSDSEVTTSAPWGAPHLRQHPCRLTSSSHAGVAQMQLHLFLTFTEALKCDRNQCCSYCCLWLTSAQSDLNVPDLLAALNPELVATSGLFTVGIVQLKGLYRVN